MLIYRTALEIAHAALKENEDEARFSLASVQLDDRGRICATDGHLWLRLAALVNEPDLFTVDQLAELQCLRAESVVLPSEVVKDFNSACKRKGIDQIVVSVNDGLATLATADGKVKRSFEIKPEVRPFPNIERAVPQRPENTVVLSVDLLRKLVKVLRAVDAGWVRLTFDERLGTNPIGVSAECILGNSQGSTMCAIDGAIMPMRDPKTEPDWDDRVDDKSPPVDSTQPSLSHEFGRRTPEDVRRDALIACGVVVDTLVILKWPAEQAAEVDAWVVNEARSLDALPAALGKPHVLDSEPGFDGEQAYGLCSACNARLFDIEDPNADELPYPAGTFVGVDCKGEPARQISKRKKKAK
jgi:hypothetical protein